MEKYTNRFQQPLVSDLIEEWKRAMNKAVG